MKLKSEIKEVVFLNWLVPVERAKLLVPEGIQLITYGDQTLLTVLTYKHGNFRPNYLSFIKPIFGSPFQSNWRFYIQNNSDFGTDKPSVYFLKNILSSASYSIGSRVFSNILHSHYPQTFNHSSADGIHSTTITPGISNAPDLDYFAKEVTDWNMPADFTDHFQSVDELLRTICFQGVAVSDQFDGKYSVARIHLDFDLKELKPLRIEQLETHWLHELIRDSKCFAFLMQTVDFTTLGEKLISLKKT